MSSIYQSFDRLHRDAVAADELAAVDPVFAPGRPESVGRPIPIECGLRIHIPFLCHGGDKQVGAEVLGARPVQRDGQVKFIRKVLL